MRKILSVLAAVAGSCAAPALTRGESVRFRTDSDVSQVCRVTTDVTTLGKVFTSGGPGKTIKLDLNGRAQFSFLERRLPPGGRDTQSFRAVREFQSGRTDTTVGDRNTRVELPPQTRLIVAAGESFGVTNYSLDGTLNRDGLDLLELPGDTLALTALLPAVAIDEGGTWNAPEWAGQMLGAVEAIENASATCRLAKLTQEDAEIEVSATVNGQRQGANCDVQIAGTMQYDRAAEIISGATLDYTIKAAVGAVSPGLDAQVHVQIARSVSESSGRLTNEVVNSIPVAADEESLALAFDLAPWGMTLRHSREWYLFHAVLEEAPRVAILRLIDRGSLIAQCNMSPIATVPPGQHTPLEQFEKDIRGSLGLRLKEITSREQLDVGTPMKVFRVVAEGAFTVKSSKEGVAEETTVPTHWIYYLCADPSGRQASFVFAVESALLEQLGDKDERLVRSLQFVADRTAASERTGREKP